MTTPSDNPFSLVGKTILVTGASSGIGRSCAVEFSKLGARLILVARRDAQLRETLRMMAGDGHHIEPYDLTSGEEIVPWMKALAAKSGLLDGLVHAAGISTTLPVRATSQDTFRNIISVNLESAFFLCKAFRQRGVCNHTGSVALIGSVMSLVGQPGLTAYCASKGALVTMAKSLSLELAAERIRVNVIAPGYIHTPMMEVVENSLPEKAMKSLRANHPLGTGRPEDVAYAAAFLVSEAGRWITGTTLVVDGGYTAA
jgi:NAD(P)-dependent dehydrogenase (short-subunit alcohol dehydrogenase family)